VNKDWLDIAILEDYLDGKLDSKTMNRVEREALEDPFVAEALAGLSESPRRALASISLLQKQLQERVAEQKVKKASLITWQRLSIASTAAVLFISVGIIFWMKQKNYQEMMAGQSRQVDVAIAPKEFKDSLITSGSQIAAAPKPEVSSDAVLDQAIGSAKANTYASTVKSKESAPITTYSNSPAPASADQQVAALSSVIATAVNNNMIRGKVIDSASGLPLANASIFVDSKPKAQTNDLGEFEFSADSITAGSQILASAASYKNALRPLKLDQSNNLSLTETGGNKSDVVIRGYSKRSKEQVRGNSFTVSGKEVKDVPIANVEQLLQGKVAALHLTSFSPAGGWAAFKAYLVKENKFSTGIKTGQSAEFKFTLKNGKPADIEVVRGFSKQYDAEAIRLIKNWPEWNGTSKEGPAAVVLDY